MDTAKGNAKRSVLKTDFIDRALGRYIDIPLPLDSTSSTDDLAGDVFQAIWKRKPELEDAAYIDKMRGVNRAIMDKYMSDVGFQQTRQSVSANLTAAIACTQMAWSVLTKDDYLKSAIEQQQQADKVEQQADDLDEQADDLDQQADDIDNPPPPKPEPAPGGAGDEDGDGEGDNDGDGEDGEGENEQDGEGEGEGEEDGDQDESSPTRLEGEGSGEGEGEEEEENGEGSMPQPRNEPDPHESRGTREAEEKRQKAQELRQKANDLREKAEQIAQQAAEKIGGKLEKPLGQAAVSAAVKEGKEEAEEVIAFMEAWGLDGEDVHPEEVKELLDFKRSAEALSEMIGRMEGIANRQIERVKNQTIGVASEPTLTKDIFHLFPSEVMKLFPNAPDIVRLQAANSLFAGAGLYGYKPKIEGEKAGHYYVLVDNSGSMTFGEPSRLEVAQSVAIGTAMATRDNCNRRFELAYFDHRSPESQPIVTSEDDWRKVMRWAEVGANGGTNFSLALLYLCKRIRELGEKEEVGWDALFLTDEDSYVSDVAYAEVMKLKAETGLRLHVVSIDCQTGGNQRLRELADTHITTSAIANDAGNITEVIITKIAQSSFGMD